MNKSSIRAVAMSVAVLVFAGDVRAQADDFCREYGETPSREIGRENRLVPFVYGRIVLKGLSSGAKQPRVTAIYSDSLQPATRQVIGRSGNYCFPKRGTGGTLVIDVDGLEAARKSVSDLGNARQREDFELYPPQVQRTAASPGVVSARFARPTNEKTADLYKKAAEAESDKRLDKAVDYVREIVSIDPGDFVAWAKLGSLHIERNSFAEAEAVFRKALDLKADYAPALLNIGMINAVQNRYPAAIEMFKQAVTSDPTYARAYRLLGEAYLHNRQGTLGLDALNKALELDPVGMAECHLLKARLFDLAGAKNLAASEYKVFLRKVPKHPDKKKFEKYINDNPE